MTEIPKGYPFVLDDPELAAETTELFEIYKETYQGVSFEEQLPELKLAIVQAGLGELSRREVAALRDATRAATQAAESTSRRSLRLAWAAVALAFLSLVATIILAFVD